MELGHRVLMHQILPLVLNARESVGELRETCFCSLFRFRSSRVVAMSRYPLPRAPKGEPLFSPSGEERQLSERTQRLRLSGGSPQLRASPSAGAGVSGSAAEAHSLPEAEASLVGRRTRIRWWDTDDALGPAPVFSDEVSNMGMGHLEVGVDKPSYIGGSSGIQYDFSARCEPTPQPDCGSKYNNEGYEAQKLFTRESLATLARRDTEAARERRKDGSPSARKYSRLPIGEFPTYAGGNFGLWISRLEIALLTYPPEERIFLLCSKLDDATYRKVLWLQQTGIVSFEGITAALTLEAVGDSNTADQSRGSNQGGPRVSEDIHARRAALRDVPLFERGDFDAWYQRIEIILDCYPPSEQVFYLGTRLGAEAFSFVQNRSHAERKDLRQVVTSLRRHYSRCPTAAQSKELFFLRKQQSHETLVQFEGELRKLVRLAFPQMSSEAQEELLIERMIAGTHDVEVARYFAIRRPTSVEEIESVADALQQANLQRNNPERGSRTSTTVADSQGRGLNSPAEGRFSRWERPTNGPSRGDRNGDEGRDRRGGRASVVPGTPPRSPSPCRTVPRTPAFAPEGCFLCGRPGHFKRNCPYRTLNG